MSRPEIGWNDLVARIPALAEVDPEAAEQVEIDAKYAGYVERQKAEVERSRRWDEKKIPAGFRYDEETNLRSEAREKLERVRPLNLGQASRIPGITPADIAVIFTRLERKGK